MLYFPPGNKNPQTALDYGEKVLMAEDMVQFARDRLAISKVKDIGHLTD